jgi:hypothetical protein
MKLRRQNIQALLRAAGLSLDLARMLPVKKIKRNRQAGTIEKPVCSIGRAGSWKAALNVTSDYPEGVGSFNLEFRGRLPKPEELIELLRA